MSQYSTGMRVLAACVAGAVGLIANAYASTFNVPSGELEPALNAYIAQSGVQLVVSNEAIKGIKTKGVKGDLSPDGALSRILKGTGFAYSRDAAGVIEITRDKSALNEPRTDDLLSVAAAPAMGTPGASLETVTVTSSKIGGDVQNIPIAITAMSQEQLTATQTAGGQIS